MLQVTLSSFIVDHTAHAAALLHTVMTETPTEVTPMMASENNCIREQTTSSMCTPVCVGSKTAKSNWLANEDTDVFFADQEKSRLQTQHSHSKYEY